MNLKWIVAATIGTMDKTLLVCRDHLSDNNSFALGEFQRDDLEPGETCDIEGCGTVLGPALDDIHDGYYGA